MKYQDYKFFLEYKGFKDDLIEDKYLWCNNNYQRKFEKRFVSTHNFVVVIVVVVVAKRCLPIWLCG